MSASPTPDDALVGVDRGRGTRPASRRPASVSTCGEAEHDRLDVGDLHRVDAGRVARKHAPSTEPSRRGGRDGPQGPDEHRDEPGQGSRDDAARRAGRRSSPAPRTASAVRSRSGSSTEGARVAAVDRRGGPDLGQSVHRAALGPLGHTARSRASSPRRRRPSGRSTSSSTMPASSSRRSAVDLTLESYRRVLAVNLHAPVFLASRAARGMIERGYGRIVNITSIHGRFGEEHRALVRRGQGRSRAGDADACRRALAPRRARQRRRARLRRDAHVDRRRQERARERVVRDRVSQAREAADAPPRDARARSPSTSRGSPASATPT